MLLNYIFSSISSERNPIYALQGHPVTPARLQWQRLGEPLQKQNLHLLTISMYAHQFNFPAQTIMIQQEEHKLSNIWNKATDHLLPRGTKKLWGKVTHICTTELTKTKSIQIVAVVLPVFLPTFTFYGKVVFTSGYLSTDELHLLGHFTWAVRQQDNSWKISSITGTDGNVSQRE